MSKNNGRHLINVHSELDSNGVKWNVEGNNKVPKKPSPDDLYYGEFAINNGKGYETIFIKNSNNEVVSFPNNATISNLQTQITTNKTNIEDLNDKVIEDEEVVAMSISALTNAMGNVISDDDKIKYQSNTNANYIADAESLTDADDKLDAAIKELAEKQVELTISKDYEVVEYDEKFDAETVKEGDTYEHAINVVENAVDELVDRTIEDEETTAIAISALTDAMGNVIASDDSIEYQPNTNANYIANAESLTDADDKLDAAIKALAEKQVELTISSDYEVVEYDEKFDAETVNEGDTYEHAINVVENAVDKLVDKVIEDEEVSANSVLALADAMGDVIASDDSIEYQPNTKTKYIANAKSLTDADNKLDAAIKELSEKQVELVISSDYNFIEYDEKFDVETVNEGDTYEQAINVVENAVDKLVDKVIEDEGTTAMAISALTDVMGNVIASDYGIEYQPNTNANYIADAESLTDADDKLDAAIKALADREDKQGLTSVTSNDNSVSVTTANNSVDLSVNSKISSDYNFVEYDENFDAETVKEGDTYEQAINVVENAVDELVDKVIEDEGTTAKALDTINNSCGFNENAKFTGNTDASVHYIDVSTNVTEALIELDNAIKTLADKEDKQGLTSVTSNDNSVSVTIANNSVDLSVEHKVSSTYAPTEYPVIDDVTYPFGVVQVKANDTIDTAFKSVETTLSALTQNVLDNEDVTSTALITLNKSCGFDINGIYQPQNDDLKTFDNLSDANDFLARKLATLIVKVKHLEDEINKLKAQS